MAESTGARPALSGPAAPISTSSGGASRLLACCSNRRLAILLSPTTAHGAGPSRTLPAVLAQMRRWGLRGTMRGQPAASPDSGAAVHPAATLGAGAGGPADGNAATAAPSYAPGPRGDFCTAVTAIALTAQQGQQVGLEIVTCLILVPFLIAAPRPTIWAT